MSESSTFLRRHEFTVGRLEALRSKLAQSTAVQSHPDLAIYATGSYARSEASEHSDLDVFLVDRSGTSGRLAEVMVTAELVTIARELNFPEFTNDGEYLQVHSLPTMKKILGSPKDDAMNLFTARMLLLLESKPVAHASTYNNVVESIIDSYYRDYHDHTDSFRPVFLANDIIRFFKTMCLNYEHNRNRLDLSELEKNKSHLKNLKLKFSRMSMCFSTVVLLGKNHEILTPELLNEAVALTPRERLERVASQVLDGQKIFDGMVALYDWFLDHTGREKSEVLEWIGDKANRDDAFSRAREYHRLMWDLLIRATSNGDLRYLMI